MKKYQPSCCLFLVTFIDNFCEGRPQKNSSWEANDLCHEAFRSAISKQLKVCEKNFISILKLVNDEMNTLNRNETLLCRRSFQPETCR